MWKTLLNVIYYRDGRKNSYPVYVVRNYYVETTFRRDNYVFITQFVCWVVNLSVMKKSTKYQNEIRELPSQIVVPTTRAASIDDKADIMAIRWIRCIQHFSHDNVIKWIKNSGLLALCEGNPPVTGGFPS